MLSSGNSDPALCTLNLLRTWRGEVPYERLKGLDPRHIDRPTGSARPAIEADALWLVRTYEPRVTPGEAATTGLRALEGDLDLTLSISKNQS